MDDTLNLVLAADDRVDLALSSQLGQVAAELLQSLAGLAALFPAAGTGLVLLVEARVVEHVGELSHNAVGVGAQNLQKPHGVALAVLDDGDEQVLRAHIGVVKLGPCHSGHL